MYVAAEALARGVTTFEITRLPVFWVTGLVMFAVAVPPAGIVTACEAGAASPHTHEPFTRSVELPLGEFDSVTTQDAFAGRLVTVATAPGCRWSRSASPWWCR